MELETVRKYNKRLAETYIVVDKDYNSCKKVSGIDYFLVQEEIPLMFHENRGLLYPSTSQTTVSKSYINNCISSYYRRSQEPNLYFNIIKIVIRRSDLPFLCFKQSL